MNEVDYIIVGQGLAGTLLSYYLQKAGKTIHVFDNNHHLAASSIAAGIINPITGRFYVKSWRVDELIPFATNLYKKIEKELHIDFFHERNILRALENPGAENDWLAKTANEDYEAYLCPEVNLGHYKDKLKPMYAFGEVCQSSQTNIPKLVQAFGEQLAAANALTVAKFDYDALQIADDSVTYQSFKAKKIIFCEGHQCINNPYFGFLPFRLSKGEVLEVHIPNAGFQKMLKHHIFIVPLEEDRYWIGSFYDRDFESHKPTELGRSSLLEQLEQALDVPFEVLSHKAAIRPTVRDRRPFLGLHPKFTALAIFNGLGAKGASLGPYFAEQMANFLLKGQALDKEVDISKHLKKWYYPQA